MTEQIEIDGLTLAYEDTGGEGPAVVFLHGLGGSANAWLAQLQACRQRGWRGIAYDQRGAGRSDKPSGPYSVEQWALDACRLLDALQVGRTAIVGHSVGSMISAHAAVRLEERPWALALCGGALAWRPEAGPVFERRVELARAGRMDEIAAGVAITGLSACCRVKDPRLLGLMQELIASNDPSAYAECSAATAPAAMPDLSALRCPLLAFCGSEDPVAPPEAARLIAQAAPEGRTGVVEGAAHWCAIEDPDATNDVLFGFLEELAP
jgi:pimeloyl-ACP methyl ester carboxylesterase